MNILWYTGTQCNVDIQWHTVAILCNSGLVEVNKCTIHPHNKHIPHMRLNISKSNISVYIYIYMQISKDI